MQFKIIRAVSLLLSQTNIRVATAIRGGRLGDCDHFYLREKYRP